MTEQYLNENEYIDAERLKNKNIEPSKISEENRNLQLGKIDGRLLPFYFHRVDRTRKYTKIDNKYGGFITKHFAALDMEIINLQFVMSGSNNGFVREINATDRKINDNRYSEIKLGRFGRMKQEK